METNEYAFAVEHVDSGDVTLLIFDRRDDADSAYEDIIRIIDELSWSDADIAGNSDIRDIISSANEKIDIESDDAYGDDDEWVLEIDGREILMIAADPVEIE